MREGGEIPPRTRRCIGRERASRKLKASTATAGITAGGKATRSGRHTAYEFLPRPEPEDLPGGMTTGKVPVDFRLVLALRDGRAGKLRSREIGGRWLANFPIHDA